MPISGYVFNYESSAIKPRGVESIVTSKLITWSENSYLPKCNIIGYRECFNSEVMDEMAETIKRDFGMNYQYFELNNPFN